MTSPPPSRLQIPWTQPAERWFPLRTERLLLRDFEAGDVEDVQAYAADPDTVRYMDWGPNSPEETRAFLGLRIDEQMIWPRREVSLAVEVASAGRVIGAIRLGLDNHGGGDFGYSYGSPWWGRGYASEAALALATAAFDTLGLHRLWATCDARNTGSIRVLEKLGLRREGTLRSNQNAKDGWRDTHLYAILDDEWAARRRGGD